MDTTGLDEYLLSIIPLMFNHTIDRADKFIPGIGKVLIYWVGTVLRIDIHPSEEIRY